MIDVSDAVPLMKEGRDLRVKATLTLSSSGKQYIYYGLTDDLMAYGSEFGRDDPQKGLSPRNAVLTNPATGKIIRLSDGESRPKPTQFTGMAYANKTVVWTETTSDTLESADWVLYAYDLVKQKEKVLARSTDLVSAGDPPRPSGGTVPRISGSKVYLNATGQTEGNTLSSNVYEVPLDGSSAMKLVVSDAEGAFVGDGQLYYRKSGKVMNRRNLKNGKTHSVPEAAKLKKPCGGFYGEGTLALCDQPSETGQVVQIYPQNGTPVTINTKSDSVGYITATSRWVRFDVDERPYVYDIARKKLMKQTDLYNIGIVEDSGAVIDLAPIDQESGEDRPENVKFLELLPNSN